MARKQWRAHASLHRGGRQRLLRAALRLFSTKGFEATSVRDLAKHAKVSTGLIRKYFGSKEGLRETVDRFVLDEMRSYYSSAFTPDEEDPVGRMADTAVAFAKKDRDVLYYLRHSLLYPRGPNRALFVEYFAIHQRLVDTLRKRGLLSDGVNHRWVPFLFMFLQIGPLIVEPYAEALLGAPIYSPRVTRERNLAYRALLELGLLRRSARGARPAPARAPAPEDARRSSRRA
jgi:AcrR family transcriptional regulator